MQRSTRKAWVALCLVLLGCSLATDFDRGKINEFDGGGVLPEAGGIGDGALPGVDAAGDGMVSMMDGALDGAFDATPDAPPADTGPVPDGSGNECTTNDQCAPTQLCCNGLCVNTSVASRCTGCAEGCSAAAANSCNNRTCGCDNAAACTGGTPYCVANTSGVSICSECADNAACAGRSDGKTQCIGGRCAACNPTDNSGCSGNTPICDGTSLTCVKCSSSPNNCAGNTRCTASGACGGCNAASDCTTPTTPICNLTANPTVCRGCGNDGECAAKSALRPYCNADGTCGACKVVAGDPDNGCDIASAAPACRLSGGTYQCLGCSNSQQHCDVGGARATCQGGRCVQCAPASGLNCTDATKPFCDTTGLCQSCMAAGANAMQRNTFCQGADAARPFCDTGSGRCVACLNPTHCTADQTRPICDATSHQCRGCAVANEATECGGATPACSASGACAPCRQGGPLTACSGVNGTCSATNTCVDCVGTEGCAVGEQCRALPTPACVDCTDNNGCGAPTPYCSGNTCVACLNPGQCPAMACKTASCSAAGACTYTDIVPMDDNVACTVDTCNPADNTTIHTPNHALCTNADQLSCTVPTCNPRTGCSEVPTNSLCDDMLSCTTNACVLTGGDANGCLFTSDCATGTCMGMPPGACM